MACVEFAMPGASVFGDGSNQKERTSPVYLGVAVHVECFRKYIKRNNTKQKQPVAREHEHVDPSDAHSFGAL